MKFINRLLKSEQTQNGIWLYILQFFQMVIPLLTFPYITRVLGVNAYGDFSIALVVITYVQVFVDYGFNYSGTRELALSSKEKWSEIYSNIFLGKIIFGIISILIYICICMFLNYSIIQKICMLCLYGIIVGSVLQQTWVFQGLQVMKYITLINVFARIISVILIFIFVKNSKDIYIYAFLYASTYIVSGIMSIIICKNKFSLKFKFYGMKNVIKEIKNGFSLFLTSAMAKVLSSVGTLFLGLYASSYDVGIYVVAQKIPSIMIMCYSPIGQVLFPYISQLFDKNKGKAQKVVNILCGPILLCLIVICLMVALSSKFLIKVLSGNEYLVGVKFVYILLIWVFFGILNNILGTLILVGSGRSKQYSICFTLSVFFAIVINFIFIKLLSSYGAALATLISEVFLTIIMLIYILIKKNEIFEIKERNNL